MENQKYEIVKKRKLYNKKISKRSYNKNAENTPIDYSRYMKPDFLHDPWEKLLKEKKKSLEGENDMTLYAKYFKHDFLLYPWDH